MGETQGEKKLIKIVILAKWSEEHYFAEAAFTETLFSRPMRPSLLILLLLGLFLGLNTSNATSQQNSVAGNVMMSKVELDPVGRVEHRDGKIFVFIMPAYTAALNGIEGFSQIWVIYWFHSN